MCSLSNQTYDCTQEVAFSALATFTPKGHESHLDLYRDKAAYFTDGTATSVPEEEGAVMMHLWLTTKQ